MKKMLIMIFLMLILFSCNNSSSTNIRTRNNNPEASENVQSNDTILAIEYECSNNINENIQATPNNQNNSEDVTDQNEEWINPTTNQKELDLDEIENLDFYYGLITRNELINKGFTYSIDERNGTEYYTNDNIKYLFIDSREEYASVIQIIGNTDFDKLRDIKIGMTLYDALAKFPKERYWKENSDGIFYGEDGKNKGLVELYMSSPEDGDTYAIVFTFEDSEEFVSIFIKNDIVEQINIVLFTNY